MGEIFQLQSPEVPFEWTGERLTTGVGGQVEIEHLHRYFLARNFCRNLDVLDVASGEGYGTALLSQVARSVTGVEIDPRAARHAADNYRRSNLRYIQGDAAALNIESTSIDVVVSFETIEHISDPNIFLDEVKRVLRPGGIFIVSSPNRDVYSPANTPANPYHVFEMTPQEFVTRLKQYFGHVKPMHQRPMVGSAILSEGSADWLTFERRGDSHAEGSVGLARSPYVLAVASDEAIEPFAHSVYIHTDEVGRTLSQEHLAAAYAHQSSEHKLRADRAEAALAAQVGEEASSKQYLDLLQAERAESQGLRQTLAALDASLTEARGEIQRLHSITRNEMHAEALKTSLQEACEEVARLRAVEVKFAQQGQQLDVARSALRSISAGKEHLIETLTTSLAGTRSEVARLQATELKFTQQAQQLSLARSALRRISSSNDEAWQRRMYECNLRAKRAEALAVEWRRLYVELTDRIDVLSRSIWFKPWKARLTQKSKVSA